MTTIKHRRALTRTIPDTVKLRVGEGLGECACGFNAFHNIFDLTSGRLVRLICHCCGASQGLPKRPLPSGPPESGEAKARRGE